MSDLATDKRVVVDYYQTAFDGDPEKAVADHFGERYVQHNPGATDGPEAFIDFVHWLRGENPRLRLEIKRVIAEGDLVATHSHLILEPLNDFGPPRTVVLRGIDGLHRVYPVTDRRDRNGAIRRTGG